MRSVAVPVLAPEQTIGSELARISATPWWLYPQVLSLDAPLIAVLWQMLFAKTFGATCAWPVIFLTAACVWLIYVGDHALDTRAGVAYSARHRFVQDHAKLLTLVAITLAAASAVALTKVPGSVAGSGAGLSLVVLLYLAIVHRFERLKHFFPKEVAIGAIFALGSSLATWSDRKLLLAAAPSVVLLAAVCVLNCCIADYWEWRRHRILLRYPQKATRFVARHLLVLATGTSAVCALLLTMSPEPTIAAAMLTAALMVVIAKTTDRLAPETRRLLVDVALCSPLVFLLK